MVQVNTFDGGLATRVDPSLLPPNYAVELVNVDPNSAVLKPVLSLVDAIRGFVGQKVIDFNGSWLPIDADSVEWNERLFYADGVNPPKVIVPPRPVSYELDGTTVLYPAITEATTYNLGIDKPTRFHPLNLRRIPLSLPAIVADPPFEGVGDLQVALVYYIKGQASLVQHTSLKKNSENKSVLTFSNQYSVAVYIKIGDNKYSLIDFVRSDASERTTTVFLDSELTGGVSLESINDLVRDRVVRYTYTYFSDKTLYESPPIDAGVEFSVLPGDNVEVQLEHITDQRVLNLDVSHVRVYRQGINGSDYWLVKEVKLPPRPGEVVGAYVSFIDTDLLTNSSTLLNSIEDYAPPNNLKYISEVAGIFIGMVGDEVRWSLRGEPNSFPPTNSVKLREEGTGILPLPNGILAFTRHLTYFITLSDDGLPQQQQLVSESQGCLSHKTCKLAQNTPVWVSYDGICTLRNGRVEVISRNLLDRLTLTGIVQAVIFDERYFILHSKGILVFDLRSQPRFYTLDYPGTTDMVVSDGELYFLNGGLLKLPTGEQESMHYLSPVFTDNNHTTTKSYNKIFVRADVEGSLVKVEGQDEPVWQGDSFIFKAHVNGVQRLSKQITKYVDEMTVPMENRKGNSIQFEVIGKGTLYAIDTRFVGEPQDG